jgi:hypothetical protein
VSYQNLVFQNQVLINLEKYEEHNRITSNPGGLKTQSSGDEYLAGASLHAQKNPN